MNGQGAAARAQTLGAGPLGRGGSAVCGLVVAAALLASCGRRTVAPPSSTPPVTPPPTRIEAIHPTARSAGVLYDEPIWIQFVTEVDTTTVSDRTVFLKLDTRRVPVALRWDPTTRRLHIAPLELLGLRRTYTLELSPLLRFADGSLLGETFFSQFTTNSLRRPHSPQPPDDRLQQSPFVALQWSGLTESSAGPVTYEIHMGPDPASASDPAGPALASRAAPPFIPRTRWRQDGPNYWAIHAVNVVTGERLVGPAWRFDTFAVGAAYDSIAVSVVDWNWLLDGFPVRQRCREDSLVMGPTIVSTIRWNLGPPDTTVQLAGAAIELTPRYSTVPAVAGPSVWYATAAFAGCSHTFPGPPNTDEANGRLADAVVLRPDRIRFSSDALAAHVEATRRLGGLYGYLFRAPVRRSYFNPFADTRAATLWLYIYRPGPAPARLAAVRPGG